MRYQAAVVKAPGQVVVEEFETPELDPRDMVAEVLLAGVCGTDVHMAFNEEPYPGQKRAYPFRLGHEWVGRAAAFGERFQREDVFGQGLRVGDRIVAYPITWGCGRCYYCRILLQPNLCMKPPFERQLPAMMSAFAERFYLPEHSSVYKVPDSLSTKAAVLVEPMAAALRAFERACAPGTPDRFQGFGPGKSVVVLGSGTIGALLAVIASLAGAHPVIVIGGPQSRLALCEKLGAELVMDIAQTTPQERLDLIRSHTPRGVGADVVFEAAGAPSAFVESFRLVRRGGTIVELGHYTDHGEIAFNPLEVCRKDVQLFGSWGYGAAEFGSALRLMEAACGRVDWEALVTHEFTLADIQPALEAAKQQACMKASIRF